ncbi:MAG: phosphohydrolase [Eubacteriales bacterium]|nr:phosphohydrolase [Eubacteriales bacterium]
MADNQILTYTGLYLDPFEIRPDDIRIEDIAHALSMMTRANGHLKHFYSIAQHCVNCAVEAKNRGYTPRVQLACLLHDAAESYISDVPRPVKHRLAGYAEAEQRVLDAVFLAFGISGLTGEEKAAVDDIDDAMLYYEFEALKDTRISKGKPYISMQHDFSLRPIEEVKRGFLDMLASIREKS